MPPLPLSGAPACVYCGGVSDSVDHTPPRAFLPRKLPPGTNLMTVPACTLCNQSFSLDEERAGAIVCTVAFTQAGRDAVAPGGWVHTAMGRNKALAEFVGQRLGADGYFRNDEAAVATISRIARKTAVGLLFFEFGQMVEMDRIEFVGIEHSRNVLPEAYVEAHRIVDHGWAEVTASGRELERQVAAATGHLPRYTTAWKEYVPEHFSYRFLKRSDKSLLCAMKIYDALTVLLVCPWPARAGPRREGKPRTDRRRPPKGAAG